MCGAQLWAFRQGNGKAGKPEKWVSTEPHPLGRGPGNRQLYRPRAQELQTPRQLLLTLLMCQLLQAYGPRDGKQKPNDIKALALKKIA